MLLSFQNISEMSVWDRKRQGGPERYI